MEVTSYISNFGLNLITQIKLLNKFLSFLK